jgi:hypothetical protein
MPSFMDEKMVMRAASLLCWRLQLRDQGFGKNEQKVTPDLKGDDWSHQPHRDRGLTSGMNLSLATCRWTTNWQVCFATRA